MVAKGDSKMNNVDKKDIKKDITVINVSQVRLAGGSVIGTGSGSGNVSGSGLSDSIKISRDLGHS